MASFIPNKTRKPIENLTAQDLEKCPIWEFAIDEEGVLGQDERWIRPTSKVVVPKKAYSQIVASDFLLTNGNNIFGFMIITTAKTNYEITPGAILLKNGYFPIASTVDLGVRNEPWFKKDRRLLCAAVGAEERAVFPIKYALRVLIAGEIAFRVGNLA